MVLISKFVPDITVFSSILMSLVIYFLLRKLIYLSRLRKIKRRSKANQTGIVGFSDPDWPTKGSRGRKVLGSDDSIHPVNTHYFDHFGDAHSNDWGDSGVSDWGDSGGSGGFDGGDGGGGD